MPVLTTTLASSRWKSLEQVDEAGSWVCSVYGSEGASAPVLGPTVRSEATEGVPGEPSPVPWGCRGIRPGTPVHWWPQNWRKGGLQPRRSEIIKEQNFYNQDFCGCEFSKHL
ncbi:MAG: epoxyqueuosine reductase QueH [Bacteroidales bacterium]|nr:epoxyqueuosine reductase QueH [Bacteroidales bacterium]